MGTTFTDSPASYGILITRSQALSAEEHALFSPLMPRLFHSPTLVFDVQQSASSACQKLAGQRLVFTSAQGVSALLTLAPNIHRSTCFVVGESTAKAAQDAGFSVTLVGSHNAEQLTKDIIENIDHHAPITIIGAQEPSYDMIAALQQAGFQASYLAVYASAPAPSLTEESIEAFRQQRIQSVFLSSAKGAQAWINLMEKHGLSECFNALSLYAMSDSVAATVTKLPRLSLHVAPTPRMPLLIRAWLEYNSAI